MRAPNSVFQLPWFSLLGIDLQQGLLDVGAEARIDLVDHIAAQLFGWAQPIGQEQCKAALQCIKHQAIAVAKRTRPARSASERDAVNVGLGGEQLDWQAATKSIAITVIGANSANRVHPRAARGAVVDARP